MLRSLQIQNIILIEQAEITFHQGFHVLTGETGAGKSAILKSLRLVIGDRADLQALRKGADKGVVQASFTTPQHASFRELLDKAEVDWTPELTVRREMTASGRNRVFINDQMISLNLLKQLGEHLMQICGQHANQELRSPDKHRELLDTYGRLHDARQAFAEAWQKENRLRQELESLQREESQRVREMDEAQRQLEELAEAHLKEGEEEELFAEYTLLTSAEELSSGVGQVCETLTEASQLKSALHQLESLNRLDSTLKEAVEVFRSSLIEFDELAYMLRSYLGRIEHNPNRAEEINRRLALLTKLKKKYGPEPLAYLQQLEARIGELHGADDRAEKTSEALLLASELANQLAQELSQKRKDAANQLERELTDQLRTLNMPAVEFHVRMTPQNRYRERLSIVIDPISDQAAPGRPQPAIQPPQLARQPQPRPTDRLQPKSNNHKP